MMDKGNTGHRKRIGRHLRERREQQGWSIEQMATMADVRPSTVRKIEQGEFNVPIDVLERVADVLGYKVDLMKK